MWKHAEHPIAKERLHVNNDVCFQPSHEFAQVVVNRFGVQRTNVAQVDVFQNDRGADEVQSVDEQLVLGKWGINRVQLNDGARNLTETTMISNTRFNRSSDESM